MSSSGARPAPLRGGPAEREDVAKELDALRSRLQSAAATNIGFPATADFDYSALAPFFSRYMLNNLGDPYSDGAYPMHTKPMEREVVDTVADLFGAPPADRWGYVAGGATEGTEYALHLASTLHSDAVVYHSTSAHHAVTNVIQRLGLTSIPVRADALGEIDYDDLADQINLRRHSSAIVIANIGTAVTEAVDDVSRIAAVLDRCAVRRRWIHGDAALSGIPLALLDPDERPSIDFPAGIDSIVTSGHKFLGSPVPCAVVVVRNSHRLAHARAITYTGSPDTTVGNSRSGLAAMVLWYAIRTHGIDGLRARAEHSRQLAAAAHEALREIGWPAHRHKHSMSVSFPTPPASVTRKWVLATHGATSLIVCMPGVTAEQVDAFVADLKAAITPGATATPDAAVSGNGTAAGIRPALRRAADADPAADVAGAGTVRVPAQGGAAGRSPKAAGRPVRDPQISTPGSESPVLTGASPGSATTAAPAPAPAEMPVLVPAAVAAPAAARLWMTGPLEESLAPMPSLSEDAMASVSPAPMPSLAGAALIAPAASATAPATAPAAGTATDATTCLDTGRGNGSATDLSSAPATSAAAAATAVTAAAATAVTATTGTAIVTAASDTVGGWAADSADHAIGYADTASAMAAMAAEDELSRAARDASADAVVVPLGPLLPTPPQSLQRQKMLRRAGMPIRL
jgi:histidine decarboxylase